MLKRVGAAVMTPCSRGHPWGDIIRRGWSSESSVKSMSVVVKKVGDEPELTVKEVKVRSPGKGEVLVKVEAAAINWLDRMGVKGRLQMPDTPFPQPKTPYVMGFEFCGEVAQIGSEVTGLHEGDRVLAMSLGGQWGACSEYCCVSATDVWRLSTSMRPDIGASLAYSYGSALLGLGRLSHGKVKEGANILVSGAAGSLGMAALDISAHVYRAKVLALTRTEERASYARDRGAWAALTYDPEHMRKKVKEITEDKGVDVAFDTVGGDFFKSAIPCMGQEGVMICAGWASGEAPKLTASSLMARSLSVVGSSLEHMRHSSPEEYRSLVQDAIQLCEDGLIKPGVWRQMAFADASDALRLSDQRKQMGKILLLPHLQSKKSTDNK